MRNKIHIIFLLFSLLICTKSGIILGSDSLGLELKSRKNWFTKDFKISPSKVTTEDLLSGPGRNWLLYHGDYKANHHSPLSEINRGTVGSLVTKWVYPIASGASLRSSPIVYEGVMYVTAANEVHALDAKTGQWIWAWRAYEKRSSGVNRGVAIYENKILFSTSDCKLVALNKETGNLIWSRQYADSGKKYFSTMAPLVIKDKIIMGVADNNDHEKGFVAAFSVLDGRELWRFWTLPVNSELVGAPTWLTGSYDPSADVIYWPVGTLPDRQRGNRELYNTHNAYHDSIVALDAITGKPKWTVRLGKHLPVDWDSNEPLVLIEKGKSNLILQANRNGMFYVIDRVGGKIILEKPFIKRVDWGIKAPCPSVWGATNWMSPSFSSRTQLFYVVTTEGCVNEENPVYLRAIEPISGNIKWSYLTRGSNIAMSGALSTDGNVIFSSESSGHVVAIDAVSGKKLWDFNTGRSIFASPISYSVEGQQLVSIVAGSDVFTFGLHTVY
ncbi:MAG TPA: PQQ-binding-like beta-propeller repeat protein [Candidatus Paceibacterota bacterium]